MSDDNGTVSVVDLEDHLPTRIVPLAWHAERLRPPAVDVFLDVVKDVCSELLGMEPLRGRADHPMSGRSRLSRHCRGSNRGRRLRG